MIERTLKLAAFRWANTASFDMASQWFYRKGDEKIGPVTASQIKQLAESGSLLPSDLIWKDGLKEWVPARFVNGLFPPIELSMAHTNQRLSSAPLPPPSAPLQPPVVPPPLPPTSAPAPPLFTNPDNVTGDRSKMANARPLDLSILPGFEEFKSLDYEFLVPYKKIFSTEILNKKAVRWVLFFGVAPLVVALGPQYQLSATTLFALLGIYFCLFWATYFHAILLPTPDVWRRGIQYACFTAATGISLLLAAQNWPGIKDLYAMQDSQDLFLKGIGYIFGVGVLEETCKALPILLFSYRSGVRLSLKETIFLSMMSGFGFATREGVMYSERYWMRKALDSVVETAQTSGRVADLESLAAAVAPRLAHQYQSMTLVQIERLVTGPIIHAAWAGVVGWFIAVASHHREKARPIIILGIFSMAVLHGLYDTFVDSHGWVGVALLAISLVVFMGYLMHGQDDAPPVVQQTAI